VRSMLQKATSSYPRHAEGVKLTAGSLFGNDTMGPLPPLPVIEQDQWIEVEVHCIRGNALWFRAALIGNTRQEKETMNSPADT